jgi:VanZ family protein
MVAALTFALRPLAPGQGPENWFAHADKFFHIAFFAALWAIGRRAGIASGPLWALALLAFGATIEWAQAALTVTREASALDVLADAAGIAVGWAIASRSQPQEYGR